MTKIAEQKAHRKRQSVTLSPRGIGAWETWTAAEKAEWNRVWQKRAAEDWGWRRFFADEAVMRFRRKVADRYGRVSR